MRNIAENVVMIEGGDLCSNVYILTEGKRALLIDSGDGSNFYEIEDALHGLQLAGVILTHGHWDHIGGMRYMEVKGMLHRADLSIASELNAVFPGFSKLPPNLSQLKSNSIKFGEFELKILHTPGHTPGSICLLERSSKILFSGDTLFADGYFGRTDLIGGNEGELMNSLEKIKKLDYRMLCPGHNELERTV